MNVVYALLVILFTALPLKGLAAPTDSLLVELNQTLAHKQEFDNQRWNRIELLTAEFATHQTINEAKFNLGLRLYEEYSPFKYDSAFHYCQQLARIAEQLHSPEKLVIAKFNLTFILLSSGLFKEAFDTIDEVNIHQLSAADKRVYYLLKIRCYRDLGEFSHDKFFQPQYAAKALAYSDSVLQIGHLTQPNSYEQLSMQLDFASQTRNLQAGIVAYKQVLYLSHLTLHQQAVAASILAKLYQAVGQEDKAFNLLLVAAIADVRSATKETTALFKLSDYCFQRGDIKNAYTFIKAAREEAAFYNARQRKVQISQVSSAIEEKKLAIIDRQRESLQRYFVLASGLAILAVSFGVISVMQLHKSRAASKLLAAATQQVRERNQELYQRNEDLRQLNGEQHELNLELSKANKHLAEANKIKEEYIGYYFYNNTQYIDKLGALKKSLDTLLSGKQLTGIQKLADNINIKQERSALFMGFDSIFIRLFPNFIAQFNALFREEDWIQPADNQLLTTELRIFALIRLGIDDNEHISRMLGYSVNTVYAYKTRVKNRSLVPNEEFEPRIQAIQPA